MPAADRWLARIAACALLTGLAVSGCARPAGHQAAPAAPHSTGPARAGPVSTRPATAGPVSTGPGAADPATAAALLRIAQAFNNAYDDGSFGAAYDRWDARSQAIISRAEYIRRHLVCAPATHVSAVVTGAARTAGGAWHVRYEIGGQQLTDTWFYVRRRWVFDILLSNPAAARLYRLPYARYAAAIGCTAH